MPQSAVLSVVPTTERKKTHINFKIVKIKMHKQLTFRFRLIFFCSAAASTALPLTSSFPDTGLAGRDEVGKDGGMICFFGVVTPVFCPVVVPSFLGNCTFLVSRYSSVTHPSSLLLTVNNF